MSRTFPLRVLLREKPGAHLLARPNDAQWMEEVRANDDAHPRAAGYARLAALIAAWPEWWFR